MTDHNISTSEKRHIKAKKAAWEANEPVFSPSDYRASIMQNLNFYNIEVESDVKKNWTLEYWLSQGKDISGLDRLHDAQFNQLGVLVRLMERGIELQPNHLKYLDDKYIEFKGSRASKKEDIRPKSVDKVKTSTDKIDEQRAEVCAEIDAELDNITIKEKRTMNVKSLIQGKNVSQGACKLIAETYKRQADDFSNLISNPDSELKEAYSNLSRKTIKLIGEFLNDVISISEQVKKSAKPRKKKERPPAIVVAKVKYLQEYAPLDLKSVHPTKIVGADVVYLFNVKLRKMFYYVATEGEKLTVAGTTILNYDIIKSGSKTIRKPEIFFSPLIDLNAVNKREFHKMFSGVNSILAKAPGQISEDHIIVKCF